jgi:hypothetical protein
MKINIKCFNQTFSTNYKGKWFLIIKNARISINNFCSTSSFLKGSFETKNLDMEELEIKYFFCRNPSFGLATKARAYKVVG